MKVVDQCKRCEALEQYDLAVARAEIVQTPQTRYHANCSTCACGLRESE